MSPERHEVELARLSRDLEHLRDIARYTAGFLSSVAFHYQGQDIAHQADRYAERLRAALGEVER